MMRGFQAFASRVARSAAFATCAMLGVAGGAMAQIEGAPDARSIVVGDLENSGFAIRFVCDGVDKEIHLLSSRDLQNAYGRALGGGGRVRQVGFLPENAAAERADLESLGPIEIDNGETAFAYRIALEPAEAQGFADALVSGRVLSVDRFDGRILTDGLGAALQRQDAVCPF